MSTHDAEFAVVTTHLSQDELTELVSSLSRDLDGQLSVHSRARFLTGLENVVVVAISTIATKLVSQLIERLFDKWTKKAKSSEAKPVLVIRTAGRDIVVSNSLDIPDIDKLLSNGIQEIRLDLRK